MVSPVEVKVKSERGTEIAARGASAPLTYSCRVFTPVPTLATQMLLDWFCSVQPVTGTEPLMTVAWPAAPA